MYKTVETVARSEQMKPDIYDFHHIGSQFQGHIEPRSGYVINPEWQSESIVPNTTIYTTRRPWPFEMPAYRACLADHPAEVCGDNLCYCKQAQKIASGHCPYCMPCIQHSYRPEMSDPNDLAVTTHYCPITEHNFTEEDEKIARHAAWSRELRAIRAYDAQPEPINKEHILMNATLQKRWLWDTYTHAVCTPQEGLSRDLQLYLSRNPAFMELNHPISSMK